MFKVRVITKATCYICKSYTSRLKSQGFQFETVDADDPAWQTKFDEWKISDVPVVQILDEQGNRVDQLAVGTFSVKYINDRIAKLEKK